MAKLTAKQEMFCQEYIKCGNQSEAYRNSYEVKENTKPETVWCNSCQLMADTKVAQRVFELQQLAQERTLVTVESLTEELNESHDMAKQEKQAAAMTGATMGKAKIHGLDVNKVEFVNPLTISIDKADKDL
jgi:phage terminase small subunit